MEPEKSTFVYDVEKEREAAKLIYEVLKKLRPKYTFPEIIVACHSVVLRMTYEEAMELKYAGYGG